MRYLSHKRERFDKVVQLYCNLYAHSNRREQLILSAGILNFIWNHWNNFWRDYWIGHVSGGIGLDNLPISAIYKNYNDKQSCHYLLYLCNKRTRHSNGDCIIGTYQEATWGDPYIIENIATKMLSHHAHMSLVLGLLNHYKTFIEHYQLIRNSFIHLNNENIYKLNSITGYYRFESHHKLIDILETTEISSTSSCFTNLIDNMNGMILNL